MAFDFANIFVFIFVGAGFVALTLFLGRLLRPNVPTPEKKTTYECGEIPVSQAWINYNIRYYLIAIIFIIFDVEIAFIYPVAIVFKQWVSEGNGLIAFFEILLFAIILFAGLIYVWAKGDLDWIKNLGSTTKQSKVLPEDATAIG